MNEYEDAFTHDKLYVERAEYERLRASHDRLLAAAREALNLEYWDQDGFEHASKAYNDLQAAIAAAEELAS